MTLYLLEFNSNKAMAPIIQCECGSTTNLQKLVTMAGDADVYCCAKCLQYGCDDDTSDEESDEEECCEWCSDDATDGYKLKPEGVLDDYRSDVMACRECGQGFLTDFPNHEHTVIN